MDVMNAASVPVEVDEDLPAQPLQELRPKRPDATNNDTEHTMRTSPTKSSSLLTTFTDQALHFLAHASNETLGACLVGLGASTYLILGRVGLVIIGVAGGIVLHATWDGSRPSGGERVWNNRQDERRREAGVEVMRRVLDWRSGRTHKSEADDVRVLASQDVDYSGFGRETAQALRTFTTAVIKDYVYYWYQPTLPGEELFPDACRRTFTAFMISLSGHLRRKRPEDAFLDFVTNASSIIIVFLNELSTALNASPNSDVETAIATYLQLKPDSSLSYILDERSQKAKLEEIAEDILQAYLDPKAYNCPPVHVFLKQVLSQLVLGSTITLCSRPEWINDWIVYGLEESETTKSVMEIVDAGVEGRTDEASADVSGKRLPQVTSDEVDGHGHNGQTQEPPAVDPEHRRQMSRAEEAMDEAMKEARRLTQLMIEEDERRSREEIEKQTAAPSAEDASDVNTQGAPTPTSSQSDIEREGIEAEALSEIEIKDAGSVSENGQPATPSAKESFTSFDQMLPSFQPTALFDNPDRSRIEEAQLTLHNATISIFDDSVPGERSTIKAKPTIDYLIQIEPRSSVFSGWMIARKYADFETLHEVLRRISVITGVVGFAEAHAELPKWRGHTKASLRTELERYITAAVRYQPLAESEGMKRFLEKDQGLKKSPGGTKAFGWPTPDAFGKLGGDMMNVLTKAPKQVVGGVAGGGKVVFGGVAGLVGGVSGKKGNASSAGLSRTSTGSPIEGVSSRPSLAHSPATESSLGLHAAVRQSQDSLRRSTRPFNDRRISSETTGSAENRSRPSTTTARSSLESSREVASPVRTQTPLSPTQETPEPITLPPPPSEMPEDYGSPMRTNRPSLEGPRSGNLEPSLSESINLEQPPQLPTRPSEPEPKRDTNLKKPLSDSEASVAVELMFAVISELYTLSSVWNIRRTLLTAAKSFLLRPGNPQLASIRDLLQESLLDANTNDSGLASHIYKLRENALPTAEELEIWARDYPEKTPEQREELRVKARKLLVTKGMPQAINSVMSAAASGDALGKVFDCLQMPNVSRGLVFGLMLQALRVITH